MFDFISAKITLIFLIHVGVCFLLAVVLNVKRRKRPRRPRSYQLKKFLAYYYPVFGLGFGVVSLFTGKTGPGLFMLASGAVLFLVFIRPLIKQKAALDKKP